MFITKKKYKELVKSKNELMDIAERAIKANEELLQGFEKSKRICEKCDRNWKKIKVEIARLIISEIKKESGSSVCVHDGVEIYETKYYNVSATVLDAIEKKYEV